MARIKPASVQYACSRVRPDCILSAGPAVGWIPRCIAHGYRGTTECTQQMASIGVACKPNPGLPCTWLHVYMECVTTLLSFSLLIMLGIEEAFPLSRCWVTAPHSITYCCWRLSCQLWNGLCSFHWKAAASRDSRTWVQIPGEWPFENHVTSRKLPFFFWKLGVIPVTQGLAWDSR